MNKCLNACASLFAQPLRFGKHKVMTIEAIVCMNGFIFNLLYTHSISLSNQRISQHLTSIVTHLSDFNLSELQLVMTEFWTRFDLMTAGLSTLQTSEMLIFYATCIYIFLVYFSVSLSNAGRIESKYEKHFLN